MTADSVQYYVSKDGDVLDRIIWLHYGRQNAGIVAEVLAANVGLSELGPVYAAGIRITLPPMPDKPDTEAVHLWD